MRTVAPLSVGSTIVWSRLTVIREPGDLLTRMLCRHFVFQVTSACQKIDIYLNPKNRWRFKIAKNFRVR